VLLSGGFVGDELGFIMGSLNNLNDGDADGPVDGELVISAIVSGLAGKRWQPPLTPSDSGFVSSPPASQPNEASMSYAALAWISPKPVFALHPFEDGLTSLAVKARTFLI
jgi:hypothetical protein